MTPTLSEKLPMVRARPPVFTALLWAYWDLYHALRTAWRSALIAFVVLSIGVLVTMVGPLLLTRDPMGQALMRLVFLIGLCFLLTPFFLAIHRFVLLGEVTTRYDLDPASRRFQLFFGWLAVSVVLAGIPSFLEALTAPKGPIYSVGPPFADPGPSAIVTIARLAVFAIVQQFLVLFPAVAVDAPGAAWQNAISDTRSHIWFALGVTILPFVPIGLVGAAVTPMLRVWPGTLIGLIANMMWLGAVLLVALTLGAVITSRLYQVVGDRLNAPLREA
jgi:hypothetical protein